MRHLLSIQTQRNTHNVSRIRLRRWALQQS